MFISPEDERTVMIVAAIMFAQTRRRDEDMEIAINDAFSIMAKVRTNESTTSN